MRAVTEITVAGAVQRAGKHRLGHPTTLRAALDAAGGLARRSRMWASGVVTVRRPQPSRRVQVWRFDVLGTGVGDWERLELCTGDFIICQWEVEEATT